MKRCHIVAPLVLAASIPVGTLMLMPCLMCWDSPDPKFYMKLLGYSGIAIIPVSVASCVTTIVSGKTSILLVNALPYAGIATAFLVGSLLEKKHCPVIAAPLIVIEYIVYGLTVSGSSDAGIFQKIASYSLGSTMPVTVYSAVQSYKKNSLKPFKYVAIPLGLVVASLVIDTIVNPTEITPVENSQ